MGPVPPLKQVSLVWEGAEELSESSCQLVPPFQGLAPSARNTSPQDTGPPQTPPPVVSPQSESATCSRPPGRPGRMMQGHAGLDAAGGGGAMGPTGGKVGLASPAMRLSGGLGSPAPSHFSGAEA